MAACFLLMGVICCWAAGGWDQMWSITLGKFWLHLRRPIPFKTTARRQRSHGKGKHPETFHPWDQNTSPEDVGFSCADFKLENQRGLDVVA